VRFGPSHPKIKDAMSLAEDQIDQEYLAEVSGGDE
jgi:hypothetical protein